jgi:predicted AAA+ superfamily ATPase
MLSSDILTEFRGRSDEIRVHPLSFAEYYAYVGGDKAEAFDNYAFYGGLPLILSRPDDTAKMNYLKTLFSEVYLKDIVERKRIKREDVLSATLDHLCSSIGSLTNPNNIASSLNSRQRLKGENTVAPNTVKAYIGHLADAYLFEECRRYDVKGKDYFDYPNKYYCDDLGLRNARIGFRQQEMTHIMENIIYNELIVRGFSVDVGVVFSNEKNSSGSYSRVPREIDFIASKGGKKVYIQSAYALPDEEKTEQELKPFSLTGDSFPKIIIRKDIRKKWYDDRGVLNVGLTEFLLDDNII